MLTDDEVRRLLVACRPTTPTGLRHHALIALLYRTGLRIREALDLFPKDIDLDAGVIRVLRGKCGYSRTVGIDPGARGRLLLRGEPRELRGRPNTCESGERRSVLSGETRASAMPHAAPLFCTRAGGRLCEAYVRVLLKCLARRAGIEKRVHAHGLRHTHAAQLRAEGVDIGIISRQLGHRSICTTARYLDHIAPLAVIEAIRGRVWRP
ncbi:MAG: tyrosine-type recombinase/integrase [Phycisphaerae bacterium]